MRREEYETVFEIRELKDARPSVPRPAVPRDHRKYASARNADSAIVTMIEPKPLMPGHRITVVGVASDASESTKALWLPHGDAS